MRLRNISGSREIIGESRFVIHDPEAQKGNWHKIFGNNDPIRIEIGMGKGRFLMDMARMFPSVNYVGIEKYSSVLLRAIQKMEKEEKKVLTKVVGRGILSELSDTAVDTEKKSEKS